MTTLLVVDDDGAVLTLVKAMLENHGYQVYAVQSAAEAIALAQDLQCRLHLLLTDLMMPVTDGHELILAIRRLCPHVGTMAMSGGFWSGECREIDSDVLPKPFALEQLLAAVRRNLPA